jgi:uncharacterized Zn-binding protein involved in type VI secretion/pimeloyl-ACP methyl ester carboxylesterase
MARITLYEPRELTNAVITSLLIDEQWCGGSICYLRLQTAVPIALTELKQSLFNLVCETSRSGLPKLWSGYLFSSVETRSAVGPTHYRLKLVSWFDLLDTVAVPKIWYQQTALDIVYHCVPPSLLSHIDKQGLRAPLSRLEVVWQYHQGSARFLQELLTAESIGFRQESYGNQKALLALYDHCPDYFKDKLTHRTLTRSSLGIRLCTEEDTLKPGTGFHLQGREYYCQRLVHFYHIHKKPSYYNRIVATHTLMPRFAQSTKAPGLLPAEIIGQSVKQRYVDSRGCIKLQYHWESGKRTVNEVPLWVPVSTPSSHPSLQTQFLPMAGAIGLIKLVNHSPAGAVHLAGVPDQIRLDFNGIVSPASHQFGFNEGATQGWLWNSVGRSELSIAGRSEWIASGYSANINKKLRIDSQQGQCDLAAPSLILSVGATQLKLLGEQLQILTPKLVIYCRGVMQPTGIARIQDLYQCPKISHEGKHLPGPLLTGASAITLGGRPIARLHDSCDCKVTMDIVTQGISGFTLNHKPMAQALVGCTWARLYHYADHGLSVLSEPTPQHESEWQLTLRHFQLQQPGTFQSGQWKGQDHSVHYWLTDQAGKAVIQVKASISPEHLQLEHREIIRINQHLLPFPSHELNSPSQTLTLDYFQEPLILNLRQNADAESSPFASTLLTTEMVHYFQTQGNNVTVFIHGFNVGFGRFYDARPCTFLREPTASQRDYLNGSEFINWLLHVEYNVNSGAGVFTGLNYDKFQRLLHVTWSGDVGVLHYLASEAVADAAGVLLAKELEKLIASGIEINVIAHSMGSRVVMQAIKQLSTRYSRVVNRVILCQPALPDTVLTTEGEFCSSFDVAQSVMILYNKRDQVLGGIYWGANLFGHPPPHNVRAANKWELLTDPKFYGSIAGNTLQAILPGASPKQFLANRDYQRLKTWEGEYDVHLALGLAGPCRNDAFSQKMQLEGRLVLVDMSPWTEGHSYMRQSDPQTIHSVYQKWMMNPDLGIRKLGTVRA